MKLATDERILNGWYSRDFISPFPSRDSELSEKFNALREADEKGGGASSLAVIAQGKAFSAALGLCNAAKAVHVGDLLTDWLPKTAWMAKGVTGDLDLVKGLFATVPWEGTFDEEKLLKNMYTAGLTIALTTLAAVPVYGQIAAALVGVALKLLDLLAAKGSDEAKSYLLPWTDYSKNTDEDIVGICRNDLFRTVNWNRLFLPPFDVRPWAVGNVEGRGVVVMPLHKDNTPAFSEYFGCMPGTLRIAGQLQLVSPTGPAEALVRRLVDPDGNSSKIFWRHATTNCGDYFPATAQLGAAVWQQSNAAGNPDMYKLEAFTIGRAWDEYFDNMLGSCAALMRPKSYDPFVRMNDAAVSQAVEAYLCWHLQGASGWIIGVPEGFRVGPFWHERFLEDGPVRVAERTSCLFVEEDIRDGRKKLWPYTFGPRLPAQHPALRATLLNYRGPVQAPISGSGGGKPPKGYRCVAYPTAELASAAYTTPDKAFIGPATHALFARQMACLRSTLVCAYVRPEGYDDLKAYAAFAGADTYLKTQCIDARKQLLTHEARFAVNLADVDAIDPKFAKALRDSGVNNSVGQKATARARLAKGGGANLGGEAVPPAPPTGGGVAFGELLRQPPRQRPAGGGGGLLLAAALGTAAAIGIGVATRGSHVRR